MFRAPIRPSSGAYNCTRSLCFYRWSVVVGALLVVVSRPAMLKSASSLPAVYDTSSFRASFISGIHKF